MNGSTVVSMWNLGIGEIKVNIPGDPPGQMVVYRYDSGCRQQWLSFDICLLWFQIFSMSIFSVRRKFAWLVWVEWETKLAISQQPLHQMLWSFLQLLDVTVGYYFMNQEMCLYMQSVRNTTFVSVQTTSIGKYCTGWVWLCMYISPVDTGQEYNSESTRYVTNRWAVVL